VSLSSSRHFDRGKRLGSDALFAAFALFALSISRLRRISDVDASVTA
jgi:hypothetical protein